MSPLETVWERMPERAVGFAHDVGEHFRSIAGFSLYDCRTWYLNDGRGRVMT